MTITTLLALLKISTVGRWMVEDCHCKSRRMEVESGGFREGDKEDISIEQEKNSETKENFSY